MTDRIKALSITCAEGAHEPCQMQNCYCECHLPKEDQSVRWRLRQLSKSTLPDSERLQVLIQLTEEIASER